MRGYERDEEDDEEIDIGKFLLVYVSYAFLMSISMRDVWERERLRWKKGLANNNLVKDETRIRRWQNKTGRIMKYYQTQFKLAVQRLYAFLLVILKCSLPNMQCAGIMRAA